MFTLEIVKDEILIYNLIKVLYYEIQQADFDN